MEDDRSVPRSLLADATGSPAGPWNCLGGYVTGSPRSLLVEATDSEPGRSEDPDHYQELDMGYMCDTGSLEEDADRTPEMNRRFDNKKLANAASSAVAQPNDEPSTEERPHVLHRWLSLSQAQYVRYLHRRLVLSRRGLRLAEILLLGEASWSRLEPGQPRTSRPGIFQGGPLSKRPPPGR